MEYIILFRFCPVKGGGLTKPSQTGEKTVIASYGNLSYNGEISRMDDGIEVYYGIGAELIFKGKRGGNIMGMAIP